MRRLAPILTCVLLCATAAVAQAPDGTLSGRVTFDGAPMPGVTVTVVSEALQGGSRTAATGRNGDYILPFLPAGAYEVVLALDGFKTLEASVKISAAQTRTLDALMIPEAVAGEITVTAAHETVSSGADASTSFEQDVIEQLPVDRSTGATTLLAPGTTDHGVTGQPSISGSPFNESLYLVNGVDNRETLRGRALDLYIEDAIQETTVATSGISAEYGRFSGGVVNVITRSGGNELSGSLRASLSNDDWSADTPLTAAKEDDVNTVYEATLGGFLLRDRLWFFLGARDLSTSSLGQTYFGETYPTSHDQRRAEAKLTFGPHPSHRLVASYLEVEDTMRNRADLPADLRQLEPRQDRPLDLLSLTYTGVLTEALFLEALLSDRDSQFLGGSARPRGDRINGTPILHPLYDVDGHDAFRCATCGPELTEQRAVSLKLSYLVTSERLGTHELVAGLQDHSDRRTANQYKSASDFWLYTFSEPTLNADGAYAPNIVPGDAVIWNPVPYPSTGNQVDTASFFVNDTWRLSDRVTLSLGLRYDRTKGSDFTGTFADHDRFSPRLGLAWDVLGTAEWVVNASAGRYTAYVPQQVAQNTGAGDFWQYGYLYLGPDTTGLPAAEALEVVFDWFDSVGGVANTDLLFHTLGANIQLGNPDTPYADELSLGFSKRLGDRGLFRADYVHRDFRDFFSVFQDTSTGTVTIDMSVLGVEGSQVYDRGVLRNTNDWLSREYDGLHTQLQYRFGESVRLGGTYTWSHTRGTYAGETVPGQLLTGTIWSFVHQYPEYKDPRWNAAKGDLPQDQRHKLRLWVLWDALSTGHHHLSVGLLQSLTSGSPYGALAYMPLDEATLISIGDHGYVTPPHLVDYWFEPSGTYRTDTVTSTDLSINYSFLLTVGTADLELFVQPEVTNIFNQQATVHENTAVRVLAPFNPFTEEPVEGVHWEKAPTFGQPLSPADFQLPRTFRVSFGVRF